MKEIFTIVLLACCAYGKAQEMELDVKSKIENVTVFLEGAQITREASVALRPGVSVLKLSGIAPGIQEQSIQVAGPAAVKILSVCFRLNFLEEIKVPERIAGLEADRRRLLSLLAQEKSLQEVYREEEAILKTNKSIGGSEKGVSIEELKIAMDYFRQRLIDIRQQLLQVDRNIDRHNESLGKIEAQLKELSSIQTKPTGEILVKVSTRGATTIPLSVKYLVKEARWFPSYDIRAKDIQSPISVTYKANVSQQSGEDWDNVTLTICSGNPSENGAKPIMKPWFLGFNNMAANAYSSTIGTVVENKTSGSSSSLVRGRITDEQGEGIPGVNIVIKGTTVGTVSDIAGYYSIPLTTDAQTLVFSFIGYQTMEEAIRNRNEIDKQLMPDVAQLEEIVITGYDMRGNQSLSASMAGRMAGVSTHNSRIKKAVVATPVIRQTNVEYLLEEPFSVKSDGEMRTTDMLEYELQALYEYYCVPKLDDDAFLIAKILNWDQHNFLEGEANLFFEGKYIGKSILDTRNISDTLSLSLGRDGNVLVTREKKKDFTSRQFVGHNQKSQFAYEISIRNKKAQPLTIVIEDQIPVANNKDISVDKVEDSNGDYDQENGLLKWKKQIPPGKTELITLRYSVKFPKSSRMMLE